MKHSCGIIFAILAIGMVCLTTAQGPALGCEVVFPTFPITPGNRPQCRNRGNWYYYGLYLNAQTGTIANYCCPYFRNRSGRVRRPRRRGYS